MNSALELNAELAAELSAELFVLKSFIVLVEKWYSFGMSDFAPLEWVRRWSDEEAPELLEAGVHVSLITGPGSHEPSSVWINVEYGGECGHLILWETGELDLFVGRIGTPEPTVNMHETVKTNSELEDKVRGFVWLVRELGSPVSESVSESELKKVLGKYLK